MSERREVSSDFVFLMLVLVLVVIVLCIFIGYSHSQIRDLQRRVGQLESQPVRRCVDCP